MRTRAGLIVVSLALAVSVVALGGQPLGDQSTTVRAAGPAPVAAVAPEGALGSPAVEATPEIVLPLLWDNGDTDGSDGYSHAAASVFGSRRALVDDFVVPGGVNWNITGFTWLMLWNTAGIGSGTGAEVIFRSDSAGSPGPVVATAVVTGWSEAATGRNWFGRAEDRVRATFNSIILGPGTYWVEYLPIGPDNSFGMVKTALTGSMGWINWADYGGLQPSTAVVGAVVDYSWQLLGTSAPVFNASFYDDLGRSIFCVDFRTGYYQWSIVSGPGAGLIFTGTGQVLNGNQKVVSFPGAPNSLNFTFDRLRKKAQGYFIGSQIAPPAAHNPELFPPVSVYSTLFDKNTADDPTECSGPRPTMPNIE